MTDRVGQQLGNYRLLRLLGRGGFADVYLGEHIYLKKPAALKVLHLRLDEQDAAQFLHEAQTLAGLDHPHIVRVFDFAVQDGMPFLVMDYAVGGTRRMRHPAGTRVPLERIIAYVNQVASALQYAHHQRLMHRDVKPENMLLGAREEVLLADFGLALFTPTRSASTQAMDPAMAGTAPYLAPEQVQGQPRPASDQYALGVVVYEWLCGRRPFSGSLIEIAMQQVSAPPRPLHDLVTGLSPAVEEVVMQALAKEPGQRFPSVQDFALALAEASRKGASGQTLPVLASGDPVEAGREAASMDHLPRGTVTLLFTDIEGSTSLLQQVRERYTQVLGECRRLLRVAFHQYHGHEVDTQGDAFFVAFARATDALSAAVATQRALASHAWPTDVKVRVRMGLHTGEPELTPEGYVGLDVHQAARIMSVGHGGQVLLSQTTRELVEHDLPEGVSLRDLGEHRLKDLGHSRRLFQLVVAGLPADFPPLKTLDAHPNNLPVQLTLLIGREHEVVAVQQLLQRQDIHLLTLTGPGGTGKTRLGLQVAAELSERFADGVFFVNLAPLSDPALVMTTIAQTLSIREVGGQPMLQTVQERLRQRQMLLLLDNFEQVVSAAGEVAELLTVCPQLEALVTSRASLHVRGEHEFAVPPLELPDLKHLPDPVVLSRYAAVALFLQRAQAVKPEFQLTDTNARAVAEICVRLDGLPLAIELAAARIKLLPPQALLERLGRRLALLTSGARDVPARQQTLRSTIQWSYDLLNAEEQQFFRRLAIFVGGCSLEAVEALYRGLGDLSTDVLNVMASLLDKCFVQQVEQAGNEPWFMMLETMREFGLEALAASGEMEATRQAHAAYYLALAEEAEPAWEGPQQAVWSERLEREHDNLRAAMQRSLERGEAGQGMELDLRLGGALRRFWQVRGYLGEGRTFLEQVLASSQGGVTTARVKALIALGHLAVVRGDYKRVEAACKESLALCQQLGNRADRARSLYLLGWVSWMKGDLAAARSLLEQTVALFRQAGDKIGIAWSLMHLAITVGRQGDYSKGRVLFEENLARQRELGNKRGIAFSLCMFAQMLVDCQHDSATVRSLPEEGLALFREIGDKWGIATAFMLLGQVALQQGDLPTASSLAEESVRLCKEVGHRWDTGPSIAIFASQAVAVLAKVADVQHDQVRARALFKESLDIAREVGDKVLIASGLESLAGVVAAQGEPVWATRLWGAAEALRETIGAPMPPVEHASYERATVAVHVYLGERTFAAVWAEGGTMTPEQVLLAREPETTRQQISKGAAAAPLAKAPTYPAGLTAREVEVLRLVAQGLADAQVAEQLVISPRTVNWHLTSIYSKLGVSSRAAATRFAVEYHLV